MMHEYPKVQRKLLAVCLGVFSLSAQAFDSGSTGVDGAFNPTVNTTVDLPASGILNYTTVNIPTGVTVKFKKNAANTPVVILTSGNVTVAGTIDVSGTAAAAGCAAGDGNQGDDGQPGLGGPGGFDGGRGGQSGLKPGGGGLGPGGGIGGLYRSGFAFYGGGGGGYNGAAEASYGVRNFSGSAGFGGTGGPAYGSSLIQPLIGGSGGAGGAGGSNFEGTGGGGGGGAILIASSGTVNVTGSVLATGGKGGDFNCGERAGSGGGGSGGSIRIVATTISGNGTISANQAARGTNSASSGYNDEGGYGAFGRVRLEGETITRTAATTPAYSTDLPGTVFLAGMPSLKIVTVAGVNVPAVPTGNADVTLPANTVNPVTVTFQTSNVPVGNTVLLTVIPAYGTNTTALSPALAGTTQNATASVSVTLPTGPSVLQAQTTYTIVVALGDALSKFAENERVERITLVTALNGPATAYLETVSGKRFEASPEALAIVAAGS